MKIPLSWLKEFLDFSLSPQEISDTLTLAGLEVEKIIDQKPQFTNVVIAEVKEIRPHPNADKLQIATVFDGEQEYQVVCGAPNCRKGIKTAFAKIDAVLYDENQKAFKIKRSKIRDIESFGMLCSKKELSISEDSDGIIEFVDEYSLGLPVDSLYSDVIFEVSLTPNLGHCLSVLGVARELSAHLQIPYKKPQTPSLKTGHKKVTDLISVTVEEPQLCPHYAVKIVQNVHVGPSPDWLVKKLEGCGVKSINNVVDVSNYILLELGQPLHVFDYDAIHGHSIQVTSKLHAPTLETLNHQTTQLKTGSLLISDPKKPLAIAGVIGGIPSGVSDQTKTVVIESAHFTPQIIRKMMKGYQIRTDASARFEKGIDPEMVIQALENAAALIQEIAGGEIAQGTLSVQSAPITVKKIRCRPKRVNQFLGIALSTQEMIDMFARLEIELLSRDEDSVLLKIPSYRNDLNIEEDLIEEIARLYGFNHIDKHRPCYGNSSIDHSPLYHFEQSIRTTLQSEGLSECITCDLISPALSEIALEKKENRIEVLYPSSVDQSILRTSLLPGLLQAAKFNQDRKNHDLNFFELGKIHFSDHNHFKERLSLAVLLKGKAAPHHFDIKPKDVDFFDLKGIIENLLSTLSITDVTFEPSHFSVFHPFRQAVIKKKDQILGALGEIHPNHLASLDIVGKTYFAEMNLQDLFTLRKKTHAFKQISIYPSSERDWTVTVPKTMTMNQIHTALSSIQSKLLEKVYLLDLYMGEKVSHEMKNITLRFIYRDFKQTILTEAVEKEHARILKKIEELLRS